MRVSFGAGTEPNTMIKVGQEAHLTTNGNTGIIEDQNGMIAQSELMRLLTKERDEARKKEEALRDRLALQEAINEKQIRDLKTSLRKLQIESAKPQKSRESTALLSTGKSERKRDGKSKDVRELQNNVANLKAENRSLQERLEKLTDFVKVAGEIKTQAISQCTSKENEIENLQHELRALENVYDEEVRRRIKIEAETHSLRAYVDYVSHKSRKNLKQKSTQTETTVPPKFIYGDRTEISPSATSSFAGLTAAAASWRLKNVEKDYREETRRSKQKFDESKHGITTKLDDRYKRKSLPEFQKHEHSSGSTSESDKHHVRHRKTPLMVQPKTNRPATRPNHPQGRGNVKRRQIRSDPSFGATVV